MTSITQIVHGPWGQKLLITAATAASDLSQFVPHVVPIYCSNMLFPIIVQIYCYKILFQYIVTIYCSNVHPIRWSDILIQFIVPNCFNILFQYIDSIYGFDMLFHIIPSLSLHAHGLSDLCHIIIITIFNGKFSSLSQKPSSPLSPYELNFSLGPSGLRRLCPQWGSPSFWLTSSPPATSTAPCSRVSLCSRISLVFPGRVDPIPGLALF